MRYWRRYEDWAAAHALVPYHPRLQGLPADSREMRQATTMPMTLVLVVVLVIATPYILHALVLWWLLDKLLLAPLLSWLGVLMVPPGGTSLAGEIAFLTVLTAGIALISTVQ